MTVEEDNGNKEVQWVPLPAATTDAEAVAEFNKKKVEREGGTLVHLGLSPKFADYAQKYLDQYASSGKKADTLVTERGHINRWMESIGELRLDKIRSHHLTAHLEKLFTGGNSARTRNLSVVCLRNVLKNARRDQHLKALPTEGLEWLKTKKKAHRLYSPAEVDSLCEVALLPRFIEGRVVEEGEKGTALKNGLQFRDYLRFLQYSGAREQEALRVQWCHVDTDNGHVMIGAEGDAKNKEARAVDFNQQLRELLADMARRRAPDSEWLFPSPQRGERDEHARTFRESLLLAREAAQLPNFGFHDLRRFFASRAVMSGIDFLTVSRWLGHKDGGILLAKAYAHLANEHRKTQAARLVFAPVLVEKVQSL